MIIISGFAGNYWKNLYIDYKEVTIDTVKDCKSHPIRTSIYCTGMSIYKYILYQSYVYNKYNIFFVFKF